MLVSAVRLPEHTPPGKAAFQAAEGIIARAAARGVKLAVFPAFTGDAYGGGDPGAFFRALREVSRKYPEMGICPGTMREEADGQAYRLSELIVNGETLLRQRQLYLSRTERGQGFSRGEALAYADFMGFKTCIIMGTDVFYPQVSRLAALEGTALALCPAAYPAETGRPRQAAGVWREAQLNLFFAVESCFAGTLGGRGYGGEQTVQAPLALDVGGEGFLARSTGEVAAAELDAEKRIVGVSRFDVLAQLNPALYESMGMFGGGQWES